MLCRRAGNSSAGGRAFVLSVVWAVRPGEQARKRAVPRGGAAPGSHGAQGGARPPGRRARRR
eukprot:10437666-Lingulodinium_polyedra.AAC.1